MKFEISMVMICIKTLTIMLLSIYFIITSEKVKRYTPTQKIVPKKKEVVISGIIGLVIKIVWDLIFILITCTKYIKSCYDAWNGSEWEVFGSLFMIAFLFVIIIIIFISSFDILLTAFNFELLVYVKKYLASGYIINNSIKEMKITGIISMAFTVISCIIMNSFMSILINDLNVL